jgi:thioredoxin reductase/NAD-dependent dihydropyrimidine dehydrogenase PreA subunit
VTQVFAIGALYGAPALGLMLIYWLIQQRKTKKADRIYRDSMESGLLEPASLHPVIDYARCLGCATCVSACPEKDVLGIHNNRALLITPSSCIGHGACKSACPTGAINLVFGTESRGVDIPHVGPDFQTNIPGIYIAGELGGMGLIRNAIEQGRQSIEAIAGNGRARPAELLDVLIIGAGPAGISAAMAAKEKNLRYRVLEQDTVGGTIAHYPRGKVVMTAPARLPIVGEFHFGETSKENLMDYWSDVVERVGLEITTGVTVEAIAVSDGGFEVHADECHRASNVLLAIGRRGSPRKLGIPGEEHSKVVYRLVDPLQYRGKRVMVVGGGDSALEAAVSLSEEPDTRVVLSYRGNAFNRVKAKNRERVEAAKAAGRLTLELGSQLQRISADTVHLKTVTGEEKIANDAVIVCAGGILPTGFLKSVGIEVETRFGTVV